MLVSVDQVSHFAEAKWTLVKISYISDSEDVKCQSPKMRNVSPFRPLELRKYDIYNTVRATLTFVHLLHNHADRTTRSPPLRPAT
ncbi:hypothetical protein RJT34_24278 [Clitoria ternatea]|uniref:Uncharacterized protein n=1 Tax=Clitoria ternatea TaxID=43366 RepID=A0AAN9IHC2_CLITE